jgi:hypothetical protein
MKPKRREVKSMDTWLTGCISEMMSGALRTIRHCQTYLECLAGALPALNKQMKQKQKGGKQHMSTQMQEYIEELVNNSMQEIKKLYEYLQCLDGALRALKTDIWRKAEENKQQ